MGNSTKRLHILWILHQFRTHQEPTFLFCIYLTSSQFRILSFSFENMIFVAEVILFIKKFYKKIYFIESLLTTEFCYLFFYFSFTLFTLMNKFFFTGNNFLPCLKPDSHLPRKEIYIICFIESPLKVTKNAFYFILKALFVLKIFKFLSWLFGHVGKTALLER